MDYYFMTAGDHYEVRKVDGDDVVFTSTNKQKAVAKAQRSNGWPADGRLKTYLEQADMDDGPKPEAFGQHHKVVRKPTEAEKKADQERARRKKADASARRAQEREEEEARREEEAPAPRARVGDIDKLARTARELKAEIEHQNDHTANVLALAMIAVVDRGDGLTGSYAKYVSAPGFEYAPHFISRGLLDQAQARLDRDEFFEDLDDSEGARPG